MVLSFKMDQLFLKDKFCKSNYLFMKENQPANEANDGQIYQTELFHQRSRDNLTRLFEVLQRKKNGESGLKSALSQTTNQTIGLTPKSPSTHQNRKRAYLPSGSAKKNRTRSFKLNRWSTSVTRTRREWRPSLHLVGTQF